MIISKPENIPELKKLSKLLNEQFERNGTIALNASSYLDEIIQYIINNDIHNAQQKWSAFKRYFSEYIPWNDVVGKQYNYVSKILRKSNIRCQNCGGLLMSAKAKLCLHCDAKPPNTINLNT